MINQLKIAQILRMAAVFSALNIYRP